MLRATDFDLLRGHLYRTIDKGYTWAMERDGRFVYPLGACRLVFSQQARGLHRMGMPSSFLTSPGDFAIVPRDFPSRSPCRTRPRSFGTPGG